MISLHFTNPEIEVHPKGALTEVFDIASLED